jgi:zinc/manganese transport system permease protein
MGMAAASTVTLLALSLIWRPLVLESLDPGFVAATGGRGGLWHLLFLMLVVLCVVSGFVALGTLMAVGLMMLPAIAARHWADSLAGQVRAAVLLACLSSIGGLVASYYLDIPAGSAIVLAAGALWAVSLLAGPRAGLWRQAIPEA